MEGSNHFLLLLFKAHDLIEWGGLFIILLLTYAETGFLLGLIIPGGETLLFTTGLLVSTNHLKVSWPICLAAVITAGILGDITGFFIGKSFGKKLHEKEDTWYFKKKYVHMAEDFYKKHGRSALLLGKFLPIIRPFNPVISGTAGMNTGWFLGLAILANLAYVSVFLLLGFFLGSQFPAIQNYLVWILPLSIALAVIITFLKVRKEKKKYE